MKKIIVFNFLFSARVFIYHLLSPIFLQTSTIEMAIKTNKILLNKRLFGNNKKGIVLFVLKLLISTTFISF